MKKTSQSWQSVVEHLSGGGILAYPTETVWGLGADIRFRDSIAQIYEIKGRPPSKATSLLVSGIEMARRYAVLNHEVEGLLRIFWPGPLTVVLPCQDSVPDEVAAEDGTVGLRCSSHPWVHELLIEHRFPITTTSANRSGEPAAQKLEELAWLPDQVFKVQDVEIEGGGEASTVLRPLPERHHYQILREGILKDSVIKRLAELAGLPLVLV